MKIAFVYDFPYPWHVGGIEFINYSEAKELAKHHEVHFFSLRWPGMKEEFISNGIRYHTFHNIDQKNAYRHGRRSIREAIAFANGLNTIKKYDFDLVIANQFPMLHLPLLKGYCKSHNAKLVMEVAEIWERDYWITYLGGIMGRAADMFSKSALKGADFYLPNSSDTKKILLDYGIDKNRISVFAPVLDSEMVESAKKKKVKKQPKIFFAGRLIKEKRLDKWLKMIKKASSSGNITATIVGKGPESENIKKMIKSLRLEKVVKLKEHFESKLDLYHEIMSSSVVLHMSEREGLGILAIESVALGTPVIVPEYCPMPPEVKDMCNVVEERDIPYVINEIMDSKNSKKWIKNTKNLNGFSTNKIMDFYSKVFKSLDLKN